MVLLNYLQLQLLNTINHSGKLVGANDRHLLMEPAVIRVTAAFLSMSGGMEKGEAEQRPLTTDRYQGSEWISLRSSARDCGDGVFLVCV